MDNLAAALEKLPSLRLTVETHGLMAKKALGQNFLLDRNISDKIIRTTLLRQELKDFSGSNLIEIGPGNVLTGLCKKTARKLGAKVNTTTIQKAEDLKKLLG